MANLYEVIGDEFTVRTFHKTWIQPLQTRPNARNLVFTIMLMSRRKYYDALTTSQQVLVRQTISVRETEDAFVRRLRKLEVKQGLYVDLNDSSKEIPKDGLILYMNMDPGDELKAWFLMMNEMNDRIQSLSLHEKSPWRENSLELSSLVKSCIVKADTPTTYKLDIDTKEPEKIRALYEVIKNEKLQIVMMMSTKNGYHLFVREISSQNVHKFVQCNKDWVSIEKRGHLIVPGTLQASHLVTFTSFEKILGIEKT